MTALLIWLAVVFVYWARIDYRATGRIRPFAKLR